MKRKLISVGIALMLVLSFSLVMAVPVVEASPDPRTLDVSPRTLPTIVLDGVIGSGEWGTPDFTCNQTNPGPVEFNVYVESDDENLYVAAQYVDGDFSVAQGLGLATALNIYIDANPPTFFDGVVDNGDLAVIASDDMMCIPYVPGVNDWDWQGEGSFSAAGGQIAVDGDYVTGNGIVEVKIPFSMTGALPGYTIGLLFQAFGYDSCPVVPDVHPCWPETYTHLVLPPFSSIQAAINAADAGDVIEVAAGTYAENLSIPKPGLTLQAASSPVLLGTIDVLDGADGVTVSGFIIAPASGDAVHVRTAGDVTVTGNTINGRGPTGGVDGIVYTHSPPTAAGTVTNNGICDCELGIYLDHDGLYDFVVQGNTVEDCRKGIGLGTLSGAFIANNSVSGCTQIGIEVYGSANIENNTVQNNQVGIWVASDVEIHFNNIEGNSDYGVQNEGEELLSAINNWWGNPSGPTHNPGYGDPVSGNVLYDPWLLGPVVPGEEPVTYDKTLALNIGWTLVSTDGWIDAGNTTGEGVILAYSYTPGLGYQEVTPADLVPVDALYLKTGEGGGVGITYSGGVPVASSKELEAGWNLISSATVDNARAVLSPLRFIDVGEEQGIGLTTLVSQGALNQHTDSFYLSTVTPTDWGDGGPNGYRGLAGVELNPFDGYWVYMNDGKNFGVIPN